jgi:ABC-type multidrug transport system fused ATPase/permease subunit
MPGLLRLQSAALALRGIAGAAGPTFELAEELDHPLDAFAEPSDSAAVRRQLESNYPGLSPAVEIKSVYFTYPGSSKPALSDVSLDVAAGHSLALIGRSGAGKSTLADMLLGVLTPDAGEVSISGEKPAAAIERWPGGLAYVPQTVVLANATVRQNVALGLPADAIDDSLVWQALERAHLADLLRAEREGLDTHVGEGGIKLSGGQRQRIGIARALYSRPQIIVFDEATSALDAETEIAINQTIRELENQVTTVIIAHRLSTVRHASKVAYLEEGRVVAVGRFDDVRNAIPALDYQASLLGIT